MTCTNRPLEVDQRCWLLLVLGRRRLVVLKLWCLAVLSEWRSLAIFGLEEELVDIEAVGVVEAAEAEEGSRKGCRSSSYDRCNSRSSSNNSYSYSRSSSSNYGKSSNSNSSNSNSSSKEVEQNFGDVLSECAPLNITA
ncbi:hypothetical protein Taro_002346 [Colocasia esculenta]|uniref:Uncharacterized protein n=1 Tax=Colocasia esculenta TaxID=4460 RepID=A0A843TDT1_COLES|nr:hypothetical protein [Colocasia esculenta]